MDVKMCLKEVHEFVMNKVNVLVTLPRHYLAAQ
jgi:hypothetical protein